MTTTILGHGSIAEIGAAFRSRKLSVVKAVSWHVARIEASNSKGPLLNAVRTLSPRWRDEAERVDADFGAGIDRGPLQGMTALLKDNMLTADGMPASAGAAVLAGFRPDSDAVLVRRLRAAGAIVIGKTNMTEFADYVSDVMPSGWSGAGGIVRNPWGTEYGRGQGSSVGSAAAVAAGFCMFAMGSETQNSIQAPASYTGVVGFKPSVGAISRAGIIPLVPSQDSPGPLTRCTADAALVYAALAGPDAHDDLTLSSELHRGRSEAYDVKTLRLGVLRRTIADGADPAVHLPLFGAAIDRLRMAGAHIVDPCDLPSAEQLLAVRSSVFRCEFKASLEAFLEARQYPCGVRSLQNIIDWNAAHPDAIPFGQSLLLSAIDTSLDAQYQADRRQDLALSRQAGLDAAFDIHGVDALIAPMAAASKCSGKAGTPVVALPVGVGSDGLPFGITLLGRYGWDLALLGVAQAVETILGRGRVPTERLTVPSIVPPTIR